MGLMAASSATLHLYMVIRPEAMESKETGMAAEAQGSPMHSQARHPGTGNRRAHIEFKNCLDRHCWTLLVRSIVGFLRLIPPARSRSRRLDKSPRAVGTNRSGTKPKMVSVHIVFTA